jgi:MFS family permease
MIRAMRPGPYLALLRGNPAFARLYAAQLISFAGDWFTQVALLGLVLELTGSPAAASLLLIVQVAPFFLLSPIAGVVADRFDRRRVMVLVDLLRVAAALSLLLADDTGTLWIAFVATAGISAGGAFFEPASAAALPNLVSRGDLGYANVLMGSAWGTMLAVGAALGGLVAALLGRDAAFVVDGLSFLVSALLLVGIRRPFSESAQASAPAGPAPAAPAASVAAPTPGSIAAGSTGAAPRPGIFAALGETWTLARGDRRVASLLTVKAVFGVAGGVILLLAVFGEQVYQGGELAIGLLFAARGLGALIGPFLARSWIGADQARLFVGIAVSLGVFGLGYAMLPFAPFLWAGGLCVFVAHLGGGAQWTLSTYGLQRVVPDRIRGRVFSVDFALVTLTMAGSTLVAGLLADTIGPSAAMLVLLVPGLLGGLAWVLLSRPLMARTSELLAPEPSPGDRSGGTG